MQIEFDSRIQYGQKLKGFHEGAVKNEPSFFHASVDYAYDKGGPLTKNFLEAIFGELGPRPDNTKASGVFDSRVHMLMPGFYPCIPGWHHDNVARDKTTGQPDYANLFKKPGNQRAKHCMALQGMEKACTEFALGKVKLDIPEVGIVYNVWHRQIEQMVRCGQLESYHVPMAQLIYFDDTAFHQGVQSRGFGWRWFGRISWDSDLTIANEIRTQVQVYLTDPFVGW